MPVAAAEATPSQVTTMPAAPLSTMATLLFPASPMTRSVLPVTVTVQLGHQRRSSSSRRRIAPLFAGRRVRATRCESMGSPPKQGRDVRLRSAYGPAVSRLGLAVARARDGSQVLVDAAGQQQLYRRPGALAAPARTGSSGSFRCRMRLKYRT